MVDWTKPIQFENGQPCELVETNPEGWKQWGPRADGAYPTRYIHRLGLDESTMGGLMCAHWWVHEDGKVNSLIDGFNVINQPEPA